MILKNDTGLCVSPGCGDASCNVPGPHFPLADTNQRRCYNDSKLMTCPSAGQDYYGQDAQYGWDLQHKGSERYTRTLPMPDEPIVEDHATGLTWQGCSAGQSGASCGEGYWDMDDWDDALAICDKLNWGGYTDWRLPDSFELSSIIDSGRYEPAIDTSAFPGTSEQGFWTSSFYATEPDDYWEYRWFIDFWEGTVKWTTPNIANLVRCVRGGPFHGRRFASLTISGDRMVRDDLTQTVWQRCPAGLSGAGCATGTATELLSWQGALSYCESLSYGGYADWRLPNRSELYSIVDIRFYIPAIDLMVFPLPNEYYDYWSSTTNLYDLEAAWQVSFYGGSVERVDKSSESGRVRCVRSEP